MRTVVDNLAKVGQCPNGYLYPELHLKKEMPDALKLVLERADRFR